MLSYLRFLLKGGIFIYSNIYLVTNKINNKKYIGQSIDVERRWKQHIKDSKNKKLKSRYFYAAINKYGLENFSLEIIDENIPIDKINEREIFWINYYNCYAPNGYNLTKGGEGSLGRKQTDHAKEIISQKSTQWHENNKETFLNIISNRDNTNIFSQETIDKRVSTWKSNPENKYKVTQNLKNYIEDMSEEQKIENNKKAIQTKRDKGYDFYNFCFGKMDQVDKDRMYETISKNNKRSQPILMIDQNNEIVKEFHSIGEAGRYLYEQYNFSKNAKQNIRQVLDTDKIAYGYKWKRK